MLIRNQLMLHAESRSGEHPFMTFVALRGFLFWSCVVTRSIVSGLLRVNEGGIHGARFA